MDKKEAIIITGMRQVGKTTLMGIRFTNHPDLRRLFLEEGWIGHPLRKDYVDEVNIVEL